MKKRIQNKETNFFNAVVSLAVLVGFLSIQFHSFVHHHEDIHDHSEHHDSNHLGMSILLMTKVMILLLQSVQHVF